MKEFDFDNIKSKLVPDEKLIVSTINRINERKQEKRSYSLVFVKYATCALVLMIIIGLIPIVLKKDDSLLYPSESEVEINTNIPESSGHIADIGNSISEMVMYYSMLKIIKYNDCIQKNLFYTDEKIIDGILTEVEIVFNPVGKPIREKMYFPIFMYEENYFDYLVVEVKRIILNGEACFVPSLYADGKLCGVSFKEGNVDFSNKYFLGEEDFVLMVLNMKVNFFEEYYPDSYFPKQIYPDYCIVDGLSAEKVKTFLERAYEAGTWIKQNEKRIRKENKEKGVIIMY